MKPSRFHSRWWASEVPVALLIVATILVRGGAIIAQRHQLSRDPDGYRAISENLLQRGVFSSAGADVPPTPTAYRPPLYPLSLTSVSWHRQVRPWGVAGLHVVLGAVTVLLVYRLGRAWRLGSWSWLAAVLVACDPILLNQSAQVMSETLATCLVVLSLLALTSAIQAGPWWNGWFAGLALGLAALCRPTFLVWAALCCAYVVCWEARRHRSRFGWTRAGVLMLGVLVALAPWAVRNRLVLGRPLITTTHGGYTLLLGNNPYFFHHLRHQPWGVVWDANELQQALAAEPHPRGEEHGELRRDRRHYALAWQAIRQEPGTFVVACAVRVGRLWSPLPHRLESSESSRRAALRYLVAAWYLAAYALALVGAWRLGRDLARLPWVWAVLLFAAFTLVHSLYWSNLRMRAPLMPGVYLVAAAACLPRARERHSK
jgi:4-amino-4-deoxy-L-arabinose transferase-like glycosyltransferase